MSQFSTLLAEYISQKNIQVYPLTQYCSLDRSTMYKYINGKRLPPRRELVEKIADYMRLSPSEHQKLLTAWKIEDIGADAYYNRQNVRDFILNFPDISKIDPVIPSPEQSVSDQDIFPECEALNSQTAVNSIICRIILKEAQKKKGRLALLLQPDNDYLFHFLTSLGEPECRLRIEHILCLNNTPQLNRGSQSANLRYIRKVLPLYIRALDYSIYYYYDSVESHFSSFNGLSCLILTEDAAVACTSDYQSGILYTQPDSVRLLWNIFREYREKCSLLFHPVCSIVEELEMVQSMQMGSDSVYVLQPEPCLSPFLTPDLVEKYLYPDLPDRKALISILSDFLADRNKTVLQKNFHIMLTLEGVREFLKTGRVYEIPQGICPPFEPEDRKLLVSRILSDAPGNYRIVRDSLQILPNNLHLLVCSSGGYLLFTNRLDQTVYLVFEEPGLLSAFRDYLSSLDPEFLYTAEQSSALLRKLLF